MPSSHVLICASMALAPASMKIFTFIGFGILQPSDGLMTDDRFARDLPLYLAYLRSALR
jgi:hypothetical protein